MFRKQIQFPKSCDFCYLEFQAMYSVQKPSYASSSETFGFHAFILYP
jgi:hypothetical protein